MLVEPKIIGSGLVEDLQQTPEALSMSPFTNPINANQPTPFLCRGKLYDKLLKPLNMKPPSYCCFWSSLV